MLIGDPTTKCDFSRVYRYTKASIDVGILNFYKFISQASALFNTSIKKILDSKYLFTILILIIPNGCFDKLLLWLLDIALRSV